MNNKFATLSAVLIVKNEEGHLRECLSSLDGLVDEIVILDSGSKDCSAKIAAEFGAKFFTNTNWQGFGKQRQFAQSYVTSDWVLWIDADERVTPELAREINNILLSPQPNTVYAIPRLSWFCGRFIRHSGWYPGYVMRLYPKNLTSYDDALVHEKVKLNKNIGVVKLSSDLIHYTYRDLEHYLVKSAGYAKAWADQKEASGKKTTLLQAALHATSGFFKKYVLKMGFLDGRQGFLLAALSSHSIFVKYVDLWSRKQPKR